MLLNTITMAYRCQKLKVRFYENNFSSGNDQECASKSSRVWSNYCCNNDSWICCKHFRCFNRTINLISRILFQRCQRPKLHLYLLALHRLWSYWTHGAQSSLKIGENEKRNSFIQEIWSQSSASLIFGFRTYFFRNYSSGLILSHTCLVAHIFLIFFSNYTCYSPVLLRFHAPKNLRRQAISRVFKYCNYSFLTIKSRILLVYCRTLCCFILNCILAIFVYVWDCYIFTWSIYKEFGAS